MKRSLGNKGLANLRTRGCYDIMIAVRILKTPLWGDQE